MSPLALALVLSSAVAHACWNLMSEQAAEADGVVFVFVWMVAAASTLVWTPVAVGYLLLGGTGPSWAGLGVIAASTTLHLGYFMLLQRGGPVREVSVLVAVVLGGRLLAEGDLTRRLPAACVIVGGVVTIALG